MNLDPVDIEMYSRNQSIVFGVKKGRLNRWIHKIGIRLLNAAALRDDTVFSERIVEYPLLFMHLEREWKEVLDFGCVENLLPIHLASLGYKTTGLDYRSYPFTHPNFKFVQADILSWEPPREQYDSVISLSTIEHVGLGGYEDPIATDGDKIAISKLFDALKTGGKLIVTVPFGKPMIQRNMRIYNRDLLIDLIPNIETERYFFKASRREGWVETTSEQIGNLEYDDYNASAPAQGVAFVIAEKR
ncbi:MAG: DUF268 domain-containing protein [Bacteroidetes bacterium]|nr:DUF268 domain-containing protein [Bacteroidota bacterium]MCL5737534.1 DUF268 domain-containing protein [Bacteroidota bacterium]